jgi:hypothetical protein
MSVDVRGIGPGTCDITKVKSATRIRWAIVALAFCAMTVEAQSTYLGMDRNEYPGNAAMKTLRSTFAFSGYWLNNPPGENRNNWHGNQQAVEAMGYGFLLLFNGREYAYLKASGHASQVGAADSAAAVQAAQREGFPRTAVIFLDQEQGGRMLPEQLAYILAWVDGVIRGGYRAGIYCSGIPFRESTNVSVVTANDIRDHAAGRAIQFFISNDQCPPAPGCVYPKSPPAPSQGGVQFADAWQFAQSPRRPELTSACRQTYAKDGNCYPPGVSPESGVHVDVDTAKSPDPSHARTH